MYSVICFHNPDEENGYLSNWYLSDFNYNNIRFTSMEQYMMYLKARLFNDIYTANLILNTNDVAKIKSLGRSVRNFSDAIWDSNKYEIIVEGLRAKFFQNTDLRMKLLSTGHSILAECAVRDRIWGIGLSMRDPSRFDTSKWKGKNLLGKALMQVRSELYIAMG